MAALLWYRRSEGLVFNLALTSSSIRYQTSKINHSNDQLRSKFSKNYPLIPSHFRGSGCRYYHADLPSWTTILELVILVDLGASAVKYYRKVERVPYTNRKRRLLMIPADVERAAGESHFQMMKAKFEPKILPEMDPQTVRVKMVLKGVIQALQTGLLLLKKQESGAELAASHLHGLNWEVLVLENHAVNAGCYPGGKIFVLNGLLERFKTDEELAIIIAHEVAHIVARHAVERFTKNLPRVLVGVIWYKFVRPDLVDRLPNLLLHHSFSHRMEIEADHIGLMLMASAGYDPRVAPKTIEKLNYLSGPTHPSPETRSKLLSEASVMQKAVSLYEETKTRS